jgi:hypothetical protein
MWLADSLMALRAYVVLYRDSMRAWHLAPRLASPAYLILARKLRTALPPRCALQRRKKIARYFLPLRAATLHRCLKAPAKSACGTRWRQASGERRREG